MNPRRIDQLQVVEIHIAHFPAFTFLDFEGRVLESVEMAMIHFNAVEIGEEGSEFELPSPIGILAYALICYSYLRKFQPVGIHSLIQIIQFNPIGIVGYV
jgi:hypothetical protein